MAVFTGLNLIIFKNVYDPYKSLCKKSYDLARKYAALNGTIVLLSPSQRVCFIACCALALGLYFLCEAA